MPVDFIPKGDERLPYMTATHRCQWCKGEIRQRAKMWQLNFIKFCGKGCRDQAWAQRFRDKLYPCVTCGERKKSAEYNDWFKGPTAKRRKPYCKACEEKGVGQRAYKQKKVNIAPHCCKVCGDIIARQLPPSNIAQIFTCSAKCSNAIRRRETVKCKLCCKELAYEKFDFDRKARRIDSCCRLCRQKVDEFEPGFKGVRPSYHILMKQLRDSVRHSKRQLNLTLNQARKMWNGGCQTCNGPVGRFVHIDTRLPIERDNLRPMCRPCAHLMRHHPMGYGGFVELAKKVAAHLNAQEKPHEP